MPGVAETWEISPGRPDYTFHLRQERALEQWRPGHGAGFRRLLAADARAEDGGGICLPALLYPERAGRSTRDAWRISRRWACMPSDDWTLRVELENPTPFFLDLCASPPLMPVHLASVARWGDEWIKPGHMVSNGPFVLDGWRINDRVRLRRNPRYWDAAHVGMRLGGCAADQPGEHGVQLLRGRAGRSDHGQGAGPARACWASCGSGRISIPRLSWAPTSCGSTCTRQPFNDARVRQAFSLVVDKQHIVEKITRAGEKPASEPRAAGHGGYEPPPGPGEIPDQARRLLAEAGYPGGKGFPAGDFSLQRGGHERGDRRRAAKHVPRANWASTSRCSGRSGKSISTR